MGIRVFQGSFQVRQAPIQQVARFMQAPAVKAGDLLDAHIEKIKLYDIPPAFDEGFYGLPDRFPEAGVFEDLRPVSVQLLSDLLLLLHAIELFIFSQDPQMVDHHRIDDLFDIGRVADDILLTLQELPDLDPDLLDDVVRIDSESLNLELVDVGPNEVREPDQQKLKILVRRP